MTRNCWEVVMEECNIQPALVTLGAIYSRLKETRSLVLLCRVGCAGCAVGAVVDTEQRERLHRWSVAATIDRLSVCGGGGGGGCRARSLQRNCTHE